MRRFQNILVGVDVSQGDRLVSSDLSPPTVEAIDRALWLAKMNSARVTFFYALDVSPATQRMMEKSDGGKESILTEARGVLEGLVSQAAELGVTADMEVRFGKSWLELIRLVLRNGHDLVIAGTRHLGALQGLLLGSTGIKLLRKCPAPVWITQPQKDRSGNSILVAHDLRPVGDLAMELGCSMAELHGSELHVLHAVDVAEMHHLPPSGFLKDDNSHAQASAEHHIRAQLANYSFASSPQVHVVTSPPADAIVEQIDKQGVELLVMGTIARTGIPGWIVGNTAERLLPRIPCSVLAVKPEGFESPVSL